jgi:hypothetical protein
MREIEIVISGLKHAGASTENVLKIMDGIINGKVNVEIEGELNNFLRENLDLDTYISFINMKLIDDKII